MPPRLSHRIALVTGGASGIGKAIAERLAAEGARVVITDIQTHLGNRVAAELDVAFLELDVSDEVRWREVIQHVQEQFGGLHILVNNAALLNRPNSNPEDSQLADWRKIFAVNVEGVFLGCRAAIPVIRRSGGGSIINISSMAGLVATPFAVAYGASKAAVRHITKSVAQHCLERRMNIRCNSVHPGIVRTPPWEAAIEARARERGVPLDTAIEEVERMIPIGRISAPADVATAVAFLASEESRQMTGAQLVIDGGLVDCDTFYNTALTGRR